MKKFLFILSMLIVMPAFAADSDNMLYKEEVNMTPQKTFSGYTKETHTKYPQLGNHNFYSPSYDYQKNQLMKSKSVKDMGNYTDYEKTKSPMTYEQFPQNMSNEDMMHVNAIQNGVQNMYMNF